MTEKEKVIEELIKYMITEMVITKSKLISDLIDTLPVTIEHLILIMLFPDNQEVNHWKNEIRSKTFRYYKLKHNKKYPVYEDLKDYIDTMEETVDDQLVSHILEAYEKEDKYLDKYVELKDINLELMGSLIKSYFYYVCNNISQDNGIVDNDLIYAKLDEIVMDYNK